MTSDSTNERKRNVAKALKVFLYVVAFVMVVPTRFMSETLKADVTARDLNSDSSSLAQVGGTYRNLEYNTTIKLHRLEERVREQNHAIQELQKTIQHQETSFGQEVNRLVTVVTELSSALASTSASSTVAVGATVTSQSTTATLEKSTTNSTLSEALLKDRDAWYKDNEHQVTLELRSSRRDRLGSNLREPMFLYALAQCKGYKMCIVKGREGVSKMFGFPTCPDTLRDFSPYVKDFDYTQIDGVHEPGTYGHKDFPGLFKTVPKMDPKCVFSESYRKIWRGMLFKAAADPGLNTTLSLQNLFVGDPKSTTTIAVNIRRGDVTSYKRAIWDEVYVKLLKQIRSSVERSGKTPEVHLFSEDYGLIDIRRNISIDWTKYDGLVEHFHLAPNMQGKGKPKHSMDVALNMRDWRHFLTADILVVGGTFSQLPSLGRPASHDPKTGKGLTLYPCQGDECPVIEGSGEVGYKYGWTGKVMDKYEILNMPEFLAPGSQSEK